MSRRRSRLGWHAHRIAAGEAGRPIRGTKQINKAPRRNRRDCGTAFLAVSTDVFSSHIAERLACSTVLVMSRCTCNVAATGAGMRARSYHASPGEIMSVGICAQDLWMNCANTPARPCDAKEEEWRGLRAPLSQLPAQMPLARWVAGKKIRKGQSPYRGQFVIPM